MPKYSVKFMCDECFQSHPMRIDIDLEDGPKVETSVSDYVEHGAALPAGAANLINNEYWCPEKKVMTTQANNDQVYLVPKED